MNEAAIHRYTLPTEDELDLHRLASDSGLTIRVLPNGCVYAMEHDRGGNPTLINQVFGSPLGTAAGRVLLRTGAGRKPIPIAGPGARVATGAAVDRFVWQGESGGVLHRVTLWLHPREPLWLWRVEVENTGAAALEWDALLIQDLGLASRGLVLSNEAYASQYIDQRIEPHPRFGPVLMSRQNMEQAGHHPWVAHGCLEGAASFATDAAQIFGPAFRESGETMEGYGADLPGARLQGEAACAALQSRAATVPPGGKTACTFLAVFTPDHPAATGPADLSTFEAAETAAREFRDTEVTFASPPKSLLADAAPLSGAPLSEDAIAQLHPERLHEERQDGTLLSYFVPEGSLNRHIALAAKERQMRRRHGLILRSGTAMLPDDDAFSATCWMHGVFGAQLTLGNTAFHKLFSVSRDPYNITRASGLRLLVDRGEGWRLLAVPSLFEMGLSDCRWLYRFDDGEIEVHAIVSPEDSAMQWSIEAKGAPCRFAVVGHLVVGEHEFRHPALVEIDSAGKRASFRPNADWLWGQHYPQALHHLVTSTPDAVEAIGSGALLFEGEAPRSADAYFVLKTHPINRLAFAVVGSLNDPAQAEHLAAKYAGGVNIPEALETAAGHWRGLTNGTRFSRNRPETAALDTIFPWFAQDAMVHLAVPRGLEQYSAAAWGTRDVCQGPVEFLLPLGHFQAVRDILRIVFAQQSEQRGDWPQWFMLDPYRQIRDRHSHGDIIVWPLKALCDYLEATGDFAFLDEALPWTGNDFETTRRADPVRSHVEKLLATVRTQFIPGTHLIRYGLGDWNDALQPADPAMRDWMVSAWTVGLLYQQIRRYAKLMEGTGDAGAAAELSALADTIARDFNRYLMPDGTIAGYALFSEAGGEPEWLMHPKDVRTGVRYSLIPMTRAIIAGLLDAEQTEHHMNLIREHLLYPDGARLMDKPVPYHGGVEVNFRRAESAAFFGREIGLMYAHSHLRYCEALGVLGDIEGVRHGLALINPISVTEMLPNAALRQRNCFFSSSDAAFADREEASADWDRVKAGTVPVEGGWRVYSSGAGIFSRLALQYAREIGS